MNYLLTLKKLWYGVLFTLFVVAAPGAVLAQNDVFQDADQQLRDVGFEVGFDTNYQDGSLQVFIARIIQQLLTFLGIVFFLLVLYAGFMWMTAAGNEDQVGKARKILTTAAIGLAIVVLSYAITVFVMRAFLRGAGLDPANP